MSRLCPLRSPLISRSKSSPRDLRLEEDEGEGAGEAGAAWRLLLIEKATFVAVDAEMGGVARAPWREAFEWDSSVVRFLKLCHSASHFALLQLSLCPFVPAWHHSSGALSFVAHPKTFHLFLVGADDNDDDEFLCPTSSLHFLATHRLDFNTYLRHGTFLFPFLCTSLAQTELDFERKIEGDRNRQSRDIAGSSWTWMLQCTIIVSQPIKI